MTGNFGGGLAHSRRTELYEVGSCISLTLEMRKLKTRWQNYPPMGFWKGDACFQETRKGNMILTFVFCSEAFAVTKGFPSISLHLSCLVFQAWLCSLLSHSLFLWTSSAGRWVEGLAEWMCQSRGWGLALREGAFNVQLLGSFFCSHKAKEHHSLAGLSQRKVKTCTTTIYLWRKRCESILIG